MITSLNLKTNEKYKKIILMLKKQTDKKNSL